MIPTPRLRVGLVFSSAQTEGKLGGQAEVRGVAGTWKDLTDNVSFMASNLTGQVRNIADVATAIAKGDLSSKITVEVKGEILALKNTMNTMLDQLNGFASEVTRVAREVGTDGIRDITLRGRLEKQLQEQADTVKSFSILLNASGHNVRTAHDGPAAVQAALEYQPDVALLDIGLPGLDGYQVAKRIRQEPALKNVVLVALTGYGQDSDRQTSLQAGFDHHLVKPARLEQLTQILAMVAERRP